MNTEHRTSNGKNKVVVITGASAGVGRATAREFAKQGASIGLIARGEEGLAATKKEVEEMGGKALELPLDVADAKAVDDAAEKVESELGPIDIWVNNAMTSVFSPFGKMEPADYKRVTEVTYLGQVYGTQSALKRMKPRNRGTIILVGSALAYRGIPLQSAYCGAKHGIQGFFDSLRSELIHDDSNIKLSMVHLPAMNTPQFSWVKTNFDRKGRPVGKIYQPEVAAEAILFACKADRREIFVGYTTYQAIWGNKIAPGILDHYLANTAYEAQLREEKEDPNRKNNLWEPVPGDFGAHGDFDNSATDTSDTLWITEHRNILAAAVGFVMALGLGIWVKRG